MINYTLVKDGDRIALTVVDKEGVPTPVPQSYHKFKELLDALISDDDERAFSLLNVPEKVVAKLRALSERVTLAGNTILFDGDPVHGAISNHIIEIMEEGEEEVKWRALVNFLEKVGTNPEEHSRTMLYDWLHKHDFIITEDGDFLAYKGVNNDLTSITAGPAFVDGQRFEGHIPNELGTVISMARSTVEHNPKVACSTGLHAGTWDYAREFAASGTVLLVKINPRDVVSVPTDCNSQKIRVSRYEVLRKIEAFLVQTTFAVESDEEDAEEAEEPAFCDCCGVGLSFGDALCDDCVDEEYEDYGHDDEEPYPDDEDDEDDDDGNRITPTDVTEEPKHSNRLRGLFGSWL